LLLLRGFTGVLTGLFIGLLENDGLLEGEFIVLDLLSVNLDVLHFAHFLP
jgi:hypothetical protein